MEVCKQAMKQVLWIRDEKARMKVTPLLAMAPLAQEDDMRCNPNGGNIEGIGMAMYRLLQKRNEQERKKEREAKPRVRRNKERPERGGEGGRRSQTEEA